MKTKLKMGLKKALGVIFLLICVSSYAQYELCSLKPSLTVLNIDAQGLLLPSFTIMNGLRINSNGLEFVLELRLDLMQ